jgi:hypothetical protein
VSDRQIGSDRLDPAAQIDHGRGSLVRVRKQPHELSQQILEPCALGFVERRDLS